MSRPRHLVLTVHGIRTFGQWQERLEKLLKAEDPFIEVFSYKYGYFSVLAFMIPFLRWLVTRRFRQDMLREIEKAQWARIDIVAHSFGTHLVAWGLYGIEPDKRPTIHTIILAGSVLKAGVPWRDCLGSSVARVLNECGIDDSIQLQVWLFLCPHLHDSILALAGHQALPTGHAPRNRESTMGAD